MGSTTRVRWMLGAMVALGCQAESPVVGESVAGFDADAESEHSFAGTSTVVVERVYGDACIPYNFSFEPETSQVPCIVSETVLDRTAEECSCSPALGRGVMHPGLADVVRREFEKAGECNAGAGSPACEELCMCEILQASGDAQEACQTESEHSDTQGFCIVDPSQNQGEPALVSDCPPSSKKLLRLGMTEPAPNTALHLACIPTVDLAQDVRTLGEPCTPSIEGNPGFPGFTLGSVSVETRAPGCASDVCLVHNFQGRVSCPYGQTEEQALEAPACLLPGTALPVQVDVAAQLVDRPAELASICSCRCDGPEPGPFCECPDSMECAPLVVDLGLSAGSPAGSYCVPRGSLIAETGQDGPVCDAAKENCGSPLP